MHTTAQKKYKKASNFCVEIALNLDVDFFREWTEINKYELFRQRYVYNLTGSNRKFTTMPSKTDYMSTRDSK